MKKLYTIIFAVLGILALSSCSDFLNVKPTNQSNASSAITTPADAESFLTGIMNRMLNGNFYGRNMILYGDAKGGDLTIYSQGRGYDYLYSFNHSASSGSGSGFWSTGYDIILQINTLLENIKKLEADPNVTADFGNMKGQALTLRAMLYFDLVRLYGLPYTLYSPTASLGVPNVTAPLEVNAQPDRATVAQNYKQILDDLTEGAKTISKSVSQDGKPNYWANRAIAARVYLNMGDTENALKAAKDIIDGKEYSLYENKDWVESWTKPFGNESIFEMIVLATEANLGTGSLGAMYSRIQHYSSKVGGYFGASDYWLERMKEDPEDIRWGIMSYDENSESYDDEEFAGMGDRMACCYKYLGSPKPNSSGKFIGDGKEDGAACNVKVVRLSEVYLIAAEAALAEGDEEAAAKYLNAIRKRSPNLAPATAETVTLEMILSEKSKELFGEGQRYWDRLRHGETIEFNDEIMGIACPHRDKSIDTKTYHKVVLPISIDDINSSPNLKTQQNPGY